MQWQALYSSQGDDLLKCVYLNSVEGGQCKKSNDIPTTMLSMLGHWSTATDPVAYIDR